MHFHNSLYPLLELGQPGRIALPASFRIGWPVLGSQLEHEGTMRIKVVPDDFQVEELIDLALLEHGPWAVYRIRKVGLTTLEVQTRLASRFGLGRSQVAFPALKDQDAVAVQYATLPPRLPERVEGNGLTAQRVGYRLRPLTPADLRGNLFALVLRDLGAAEARHMADRLSDMAYYGLPNYFDEQRFGSFSAHGEPIGKAILRRDAAGALHAYLTQPFAGDPRAVRTFKREAATLWPNWRADSDWRAMFESAPKPSNYRSVLTYLIGHPTDYRKALNLIPQRLLSIYLSAYQSVLWNTIVARYLEQIYTAHHAPTAAIRIAGRELPLHLILDESTLAELSALRIALPEHRALYRHDPVAEIAQQVLQEEGLALDDLKARILQKAYLTKGERRVLLFPQDIHVASPEVDERYAGRYALSVRFALPPGSYATLVLKAAHEPEVTSDRQSLSED
jgi:tRNA pseudouridine13 synthase